MLLKLSSSPALALHPDLSFLLSFFLCSMDTFICDKRKREHHFALRAACAGLARSTRSFTSCLFNVPELKPITEVFKLAYEKAVNDTDV